MSETLAEKSTRLTRQMLRAMRGEWITCEGCHTDMTHATAFRCLECKFWFHQGCLQLHFAETKPAELSRYERALIFALRAHGDQKRRYTGEPYLVHPIAVAGMLADAGLGEDVVIAAVLHDCIEDTSVVYGDIRREFGAHVADLVLAVSDISKPGDGNREARKAIDRDHLASASMEAQSLKVADLISNTTSICEHDPKFAKVYLAEKRALLAVLTRANPKLLRRVYEVLEAGEKKVAE